MRAFCILALDDEQLSLNLVARTFEDDLDVRLLTSTSAREALDLVRNEPLDLALVDQRMPEMTGLAFVSELEKTHPRAVRILLTAYPDLTVVLKAINEGHIYRFMLKPWDPDDMRITIRRAIEAKRLAEENERMAAQIRAQFEELVRSEKMAVVGRLAAGLAHELSNPLSALLGNLSLLELELQDQLTVMDLAERAIGSKLESGTLAAYAHAREELHYAEVRQHLSEIVGEMHEAGNRTRGIVAGLRRYSHPGADVPEEWDVNAGVESAIQVLGARLRNRIKLERELGELPLIRCRGQMVGQVLVNLLANAADALEEVGGGEVRVRTSIAAGVVRIEIADNGPGIPELVRARLFQPFLTTKAVGRGTGLGLSICKEIIDRHDGRIEVDTAPGQGTRFTVVLPAQ